MLVDTKEANVHSSYKDSLRANRYSMIASVYRSNPLSVHDGADPLIVFRICSVDWSGSPGSRAALGVHYTSEHYNSVI